jgi:hypothetical protein
MTEILAKIGIGKSKGGTREINYNFRGIDDIRNTIAPLQKECALAIIPRLIERVENDTRTTKNGGFSLWVVVKMEFDFINTIDGSSISVPVQGEAVDYSDKATQKAISQAYKMACINVFNIPTEGEEDTDAEKIVMQGKQTAIFETAALRDMYVQNCKDAFERAETVQHLKDRESMYHDKLILMRHSKDAVDVENAKELANLYKERLETLSQPKAKL